MPALRFPRAPRRTGSSPSRPRLARPVLAVLLVASAVGLAACGGGGGSAATTATSAIPTTTTGGAGAAGGPAGGPNRAAFTKYTTCLKQHGVTLPAFGNRGAGGGGGGTPPAGGAPTTTPRRGGFGAAFSNPKFRAAQAACGKLLPAGARGGFGGRGPGGGGFGGNTAAFAAYRNCLTLHGVKLGAGGFGGFGRPGAGGKAPTAKQQAALKACASLRPTFNRPQGTATNPNSTTTS